MLVKLIFDDKFSYNIVYVGRRRPQDEDLEEDATSLDHRNNPDNELREEARQRIKRIYNVDIDTIQGERTCKKMEDSIEREMKKRKLDRDEFNDMPGVDSPGPSTPMSSMSEDSDHKQLMQDEQDFIDRKISEYREENSHKTDYTEEDALEYAKSSLSKLKDKYDNPDADYTETDNQDERTTESNTNDSSDSQDDLTKDTNISTQIKNIVRGGGTGGVSSGGNSDGESDNNGGSNNDSSNFFTASNFLLLFFSFIEVIAQHLECFFL